MALNVNGLFPGELLPDTTIGGCIDIYENVWPNPQRTIELIEHECQNTDNGVYWEKAGTIGDGPYQNQRTNKLIGVTRLANLSNNKVLQNIHNQFYLLLLATTNPYAIRHGINETFYHEGYNLLKYSGGEEYKEHYDSSTGNGRAVSALCYLNDDYDGGELEFPAFDVKIIPQPGMLILFPSNFAYRHIAHPVTKGSKYSLVTWIHDRPFNDN